MSKEYCSKCNKCMTDEDGTTIIGFKMSVIVDNKEKLDFMKKQFGKYEIKDIQICYECWIDSVMK